MQQLIESLEPRRLMASAASEEPSGGMDAAPEGQRLNGGSSSIADIFGEDSRRHVVSTLKYPYSAVGRLQSTWDDANIISNCSGAMISSYHFLTAAHCVFNSERGGFADEVTITPGRNGKQQPFGSADFSYMRIPRTYSRFEETAYDYALITLDERIGEDSSWFGYASYSADSFRGRTVHTSGYPRDLGSTKQYRQSGETARATSTEILTNLDAAVGQSGSPVWVRKKQQNYIVGVLTSSNSSYTYLSRITRSRFDQLDTWMDQDDSRRRPTRSDDRQLRADTTPFSATRISTPSQSLFDATSHAELLS